MAQRVLRDRLIDLEVPRADVARGRALHKTAPAHPRAADSFQSDGHGDSRGANAVVDSARVRRRNDTVHRAVADWSYAYAEKSLDDFHQVRAAAVAGEIEAAGDPGR